MIKADSRKYHPEFDMQFARGVYAASQDASALKGEMISGPYDLYSVEELRDRCHLRIGIPIPADVFVFCKGEPKKADVTKVGGIPYWIDDRKWPVGRGAKPLRFLAQFNFLDSMDLVGPLPGEVLSLFVGQGDDWTSGTIHFEWLPAGRSSVGVNDAKRILFPNSIFCGAIYRTADYPSATEIASQTGVSCSGNLPLLNGTKLGGRPHHIQSDDDLDPRPEEKRENPFRPGKMMVAPARPSRRGYLCQLGSIQTTPRVEYPWANQSKPIKRLSGVGSITSEANEICFVDMGSIYVYRNEKGGLWSALEYY